MTGTAPGGLTRPSWGHCSAQRACAVDSLVGARLRQEHHQASRWTPAARTAKCMGQQRGLERRMDLGSVTPSS